MTDQNAHPLVTPDSIKLLTLEAASLIQRDGLTKARPQFEKTGKFRFADTYVNVIDFHGVWRVYPPRPDGEGKSIIGVQDADGKFLVRDIIDLARRADEGWISYRWLNPVSQKIQSKMSYVKRVPGQNLIVYVGIYR